MHSSIQARPCLGRSTYVINQTVPTLTWGMENPEFHTRISLFNYYSYLFKDSTNPSRAIIYLFHENGSDAGTFEKEIDPFGQWQFFLSAAVKNFRGSIGVQLIPRKMPPLRHSKYVGTLFFATYWSDKGTWDYTHETDRMRFEEDWDIKYDSTPIPASSDIETSVILQNNFFGEDPSKCDPSCRLEIRSADGSILLKKNLELDGPRASRVLPLSELLPNYRQQLGGKPGSIHVWGRHINQAMTLQTHANGDFNIHHF